MNSSSIISQKISVLNQEADWISKENQQSENNSLIYASKNIFGNNISDQVVNVQLIDSAINVTNVSAI